MSENNADVQWLRQMLADYRIAYDDHPVGRRIALNVFIHSLRQRAERAERILDALREPSESVVRAGHEAYVLKIGQIYADEGHVARAIRLWQAALRAAVAVAEQEVKG